MPQTKPSAARPMVLCLFAVAMSALLASVWIGAATLNVLLILIESLPYLAAVWIAASGFAWPGRTGDKFASIGVGMLVLLLGWWLFAWAGLLNAAVAWSWCSLGIALAIARWYRHSKQPHRKNQTPWSPWWLLLVPGGLLLVVAACIPPGLMWRVEASGYDVTSYHLQLPRQWLAAGAMVPLKHNVYSYLPNLVETSYAMHGAMRGSVVEAVYLAQLFHASLAIYAAIVVGGLVRPFTDVRSGAIAAGLMLLVPWVIVTGSLAYNEMAALAFAAAALRIAFDVNGEKWTGPALVGALLGGATLCKLTAGPMFAVPIGLILLLRLNHAIRWRSIPDGVAGLRSAAIAAAFGLIVLSPYFIRNAVWTSNPVFPFATNVFGEAHWQPQQVEQWQAAHGVTFSQDSKLTALRRQWLVNSGYAAIGGIASERAAHEVARFAKEGGLPIFWIAAGLGLILTLRRSGDRRMVIAMTGLLVVQLGFWMFATHLQSRFLLPTVLPGAVLAGVGLCAVMRHIEARMRWLTPVVPVILAMVMAVHAWTLTISQTPENEGKPIAVASLVDQLSVKQQHPINALPPDVRVLVVADNGSLLYLDRAIVYASAFDANVAKKYLDNPDQLAADGITHVWAGWSEMNRLGATYGYDPSVVTELRRVARKWRVVNVMHYATLYEVQP